MAEEKQIKTEKSKNKITKKMSFSELLEKHPEAVELLLAKGMHCIGCPMAMQENLEQGALAHGLNPDKLVMELNEKIKQDESKNKK